MDGFVMPWDVDMFASLTEDPYLQIGGAAALLSAVSYSLAYKSSQLLSPKLCRAYQRLKRQDKIDWNTRLPSTLHSLVVTFLCFWALCYSGDFFDTPSSSSGSSYGSSGSSSSSLPVALRVSELSYAIIGVSFGYFLTDAAVITAHPEISTTEMFVHHAVALLSLAVAAQVRCMHVYLLMVLLSEMTTPFVNLRWYLDKAALKSNRLYTVNGLLLLLAWGVARVVLFVPFYLHVLTSWGDVKEQPLHALVLLLGVPLLLFVLNTIWFVKIVRGAYKLVFKPSSGGASSSGAAAVQQQCGSGAVSGSSKQADSSSSSGSGGVVEILAYSRRPRTHQLRGD